MSILQSALYLFPPVAWWRSVMPCKTVELLAREPFEKMTCRNRYRIATANGPLLLTVPVAGGRALKAAMDEVRIDYRQDWPKQHWRSIFSAYGRAPFFEHYGPVLERLLHQRHPSLAALDIAALEWAAAELRLSTTFRQLASAPQQRQEREAFAEGEKEIARYPQVFEDRHGFLPNLSVLDLMMNEGPAAKRLLAV